MSNSIRPAEIASHSASQTESTPCFPERNGVCSVPVPATSRRQGHPWPVPAVFCATRPPRRAVVLGQGPLQAPRQEVVTAFVMIRSGCVRELNLDRAAHGTNNVPPGPARSKASTRICQISAKIGITQNSDDRTTPTGPAPRARRAIGWLRCPASRSPGPRRRTRLQSYPSSRHLHTHHRAWAFPVIGPSQRHGSWASRWHPCPNK